MTTTYHLNVSELSVELLNSIKAAFKDKIVDITVSEAAAVDETEYLLSSPANRAQLEQAMKDLEDGKGTTFTLEEFQKIYGNEGDNI